MNYMNKKSMDDFPFGESPSKIGDSYSFIYRLEQMMVVDKLTSCGNEQYIPTARITHFYSLKSATRIEMILYCSDIEYEVYKHHPGGYVEQITSSWNETTC